MKLRGYQSELVELSAGSDNVLIQADTGSGKTPVLATIASQGHYVIAVAHRNILVKQLSKTLARMGVGHTVLAAKSTVRGCIVEHRRLGLSEIYTLSSQHVQVASIDTLLSRHRRGTLGLDVDVDVDEEWLILVDEAHHMIDANKWGSLTKIFKNSRVIGFTATPCRLDGESLSSKKGGVFDRLIQASELKKDSVKKLIEKGYLSDFKAYSVPEIIDDGALKLGSHDYTYKSLSTETGKVVFEMAGDAIKHYKRLADGKQALAFCVSIEIAKKSAESFRDAGIPSAAIHSKLSQNESNRIFDLFERRVIKVLFNVDMIGEGVDVPAIEALIMMRKTASFALYRQWIGRSLRPEQSKPHAILIDHVGNIRTHGLPDEHVEWNLENPPKQVKSNLNPCPKCSFLVKAWTDYCPECGEDLRKSNAYSASDVKYINYALVEIERRKIAEGVKKSAREKELRDNLQILSERTSGFGALKKSVHKVKRWVADVLQSDGVSVYDLNRFFTAESDTGFWIQNFTFADINNNKEKPKKVYQKWLRSK